MEYVIKTNSLCKNYGRNKVLKNLNVNVPKGSIYGLVGNNGAGKSTFMRIILGIQEPTSGEYYLFNVKNNDRKISKVRGRFGGIIEIPSMYLGMSARENLMEQYRYLGIPNFDGIDELLDLVGLSGAGKKITKNFSLGMKQRLGLAMALAGNPDCIILDEPMNGLDPEGIIEIREVILKLNRERDITFVISSHILDELSKIATHYGFIKDGSLIEEVTTEEIDSKCRKASAIVVENVDVLINILDKNNYDYELNSHGKVVVYGEFDINDILPQMVDAKVRLVSYESKNESLESYYINVFGNKGKEES